MSKFEETKISNRLATHYKIVEKMGHIVVGAFLYGPQNYTFTLKEKDTFRVRSKVLVIPSITNLLERVSYEIQEFDDGEDTIEIIDINTLLNSWKNGNLQMLEILYTDYASINPQYASAIYDLKKMKEQISLMNPSGFISTCKSLAQSALSEIDLPAASEKERLKVGEALYEAYRINSILQDFIEKGHTFQQAMYEIPDWLKNILELKNADNSAMSDEEILRKAKQCSDLISVRIETLSADTALKLHSNTNNADTSRLLTQACSDLIESGLMNKLSGNNEQLNLINKSYSSALKELDKNHKIISETKMKHQAELTQKDEEWKTILRKQEEEFKTKLTDKDNLLDDVRHGYISQITDIKEHHKQELLQVSEKLKIQIRTEFTSQITELNKQIQDNKKQLDLEKEINKQLREDYQKSLAELEHQQELLIYEKQEIYKKELQEKEQSFETILDESQKEAEKEKEEQRLHYEEKIAETERLMNESLSRIESLEQQRLPEYVTQLESELAESKMLCDTINQELQQAEDRIRELEESFNKKRKHFWQF